MPLTVLTLLLSVCWFVNIRFGASSLLEPDLVWITSQMSIEGIQKRSRGSLHIKCMEQYCASCTAYITTAPAEKSINAVPWDDCKYKRDFCVVVSACMKHAVWFHCVKKKTPFIVKFYSMKRIIFLYAIALSAAISFLTYLCDRNEFRTEQKKNYMKFY